MNKWGKDFWIDFGERVGSTLVYALLGWLAASQIPDADPKVLWTTLGLPVVVSALKCLAANMASPGSGASLVPPPEGPAV